VILRIALLALGLAALAGSIAVARPERFAITWSTGVLIAVLAAGAVASDAVPLRRVALVCSVLTLLAGFGLLYRGEVHIPLAAAVVVLQAVALTETVRSRRRERAAAAEGVATG
jgi:cytochrome c556